MIFVCLLFLSWEPPESLTPVPPFPCPPQESPLSRQTLRTRTCPPHTETPTHRPTQNGAGIGLQRVFLPGIRNSGGFDLRHVPVLARVGRFRGSALGGISSTYLPIYLSQGPARRSRPTCRAHRRLPPGPAAAPPRGPRRPHRGPRGLREGRLIVVCRSHHV